MRDASAGAIFYIPLLHSNVQVNCRSRANSDHRSSFLVGFIYPNEICHLL